ncbi:MAG: hypothetical protein ABFD92_14290 [Planctomycetaceae bacterium]|nr:hypothetical protein [Planctomycetaceae bacterium]
MSRNNAVARMDLSDADRKAIAVAAAQGAGELPKTRKAYDDDLLIEIIARGDVPQREIVQTIGISARMVRSIIKGDSRKDLQPRIEAAREKYRQKAAQQAAEIRQAVEDMPLRSRKQAEYDDDELVEMLACRVLTQRQIAERLGLSLRYLRAVSCGEKRPELQPRILEAIGRHRELARRKGIGYLEPLLDRQAQVAMEGDGETARKAREYMISMFIDEGGPMLAGGARTQWTNEPEGMPEEEEEELEEGSAKARIRDALEECDEILNGYASFYEGEFWELAALPKELKNAFRYALDWQNPPRGTPDPDMPPDGLKADFNCKIDEEDWPEPEDTNPLPQP